MEDQEQFDMAIGKLDRILSLLVGCGRKYKQNKACGIFGDLMDEANAQTLKHHAEDMIAAANKILKDLGHEGYAPVVRSV